MKKILSILLFALGFYTSAQVLIDKTAPTNSSVVLEFGTEIRGILLRPVSLPSTPSAGTILFDDDSGSFRYYDTSWSPVNAGGLMNTVTDFETTGAVIIDGITSDANGIFILENKTGALVLPKLESGALNIKNPVAGLLYYDTDLKAVMVYNGNEWISY
ncbi:hypothetical protein [Nonlabens agnitus]|uniref:Uncharacterized protein n=1 Tax=Nonlabens agnitus TaxID=870484 RepID=A0A2S9WRF2_9FLAO|nr:hypothetical protein [Nonlabens agnitus]PRP66053.1 hypothetical protein BST86_02610 [Nonlabens agnitus]